MTKRADEFDRRVVISEIWKRKEILFGDSSKESKKLRSQAWKQIHAYAVRRGLYSSDKAWSYARDVLWFNFRKSTANKLRCLEMGKQNVKIKDFDKMIIEIDRTKFEQSGVHLPETSNICTFQEPHQPPPAEEPPKHETHQQRQPQLQPASSSLLEPDVMVIKAEPMDDMDSFQGNNEPDPNTPEICHDEDVQPQQESSVDPEPDDDIRALQKKHLELQIRSLEIQNYKELLTVFKMEKELGIRPSKLTKKLQRD